MTGDEKILKFKDVLETLAVEVDIKVNNKFRENKVPIDLKIDVYLLCFISAVYYVMETKQVSKNEIADYLNKTLNMFFTENDIDLLVQKILSNRSLLN